MQHENLAPLAEKLRDRGRALKSAGMLERMDKGPQLVEETADLLVELARRVDALTPFADEVA